MSTPPILLVEKTPSVQKYLKSVLTQSGRDVVAVGSMIEAQARFRQISPDLVLLDPDLADGDGISLISEFRNGASGTRIIIATSDSSVPRIVAFMRAGAFDVLAKPVRDLSVIEAIERASAPTSEAKAPPRLTRMIGSAPVFLDALARIYAATHTGAPVLLTGERGTGKSLAARHIHARSAWAGGAFAKVSGTTAARPDLDRALQLVDPHRNSDLDAVGTLFVEHLCHLNPALQATLLGALEAGEICAANGNGLRAPRLICATGSDPENDIRNGRLNRDLFHRLNNMQIHLPALRERGRDVLLIANRAIETLSGIGAATFTSLSPKVEDLFRAQAWPGNITELLKVIGHAAMLHDAECLTPDMLPDPYTRATRAPGPLDPLLDAFQGQTLAELERHIIEDALARASGSVPETARRLDLSPSTLYRKLGSWAKTEATP